MKQFIDDGTYMALPCGYYETVDVDYKDGTVARRTRAGDVWWKSGDVNTWKLSDEQGTPIAKSSGSGGYFVDNTGPSSAQQNGLEDSDFEFY